MKDVGLVVFVFFVLLIMTALVVANCAQQETCESRGGQWYQPYKSRGICLKPGAIQ